MTSKDSKIRVGVRIRPVPNASRNQISVGHSKETSSVLIMDVTTNKCVQQLSYDHVFGTEDKTVSVYNAIAKDIVLNAVKGFNGTIFAYGQTSSGKTHTMIGDVHNPGIVRLALVDIFDSIEKTPDRVFLLRMSILDIYNENLTDLLDPRSTNKLTIREGQDGTVYVENLSEQICTSPDDIIQLLNDGLARRHVGATNMNEYSSRSHSICRLIIESRPREEEGVVNVSQLNFVDLAGSERVSQTGASGERLKEGQAINKSLFMLTLVITKLSEGQSFVNFRDSKLTRILQNALGGNSLTAIVCTCSPLLTYLEQTLSTLKFACNARNIATKPTLNENVSNEAMMKRMQQEIAELRAKIALFQSADQDQDQRDKASKELAEKEQLFRGAICFSKLGSFDDKPVKKFRRLTWAPRDRCNFALSIEDDDGPATQNSGPSTAIKRDLKAVFGISDATGQMEMGKSDVEPKRGRRREVIFQIPRNKPIAESPEEEAEEMNQNPGFDDEPLPSHGDVATGILVSFDETPTRSQLQPSAPVEVQSVTAPMLSTKEDKETQSDPPEPQEEFIGRAIFLEDSMAHFEAREEIVKLECEVRRISQENAALKEQLEEAVNKEPVIVNVPVPSNTCDKCRNAEDELAMVNGRYISLKTKYDQVVAALEEERGNHAPRPSSPTDNEASENAQKRTAELEELLKLSAERVNELENKLASSSLLSSDLENQLAQTRELLRLAEEEKLCTLSKLKDAEMEIEASKIRLIEIESNLEISKLATAEAVLKNSEIESELVGIRNDYDRVLGENVEFKAQVAAFSSDRVEFDNKITSHNEELAALKNTRLNLENRIKELSEEVSELTDQLIASNGKVAGDQAQWAEEKIGLVSRIDELEKLNESNQSSRLELEEKLKTIEEEFLRLKDELNSLNGKIEACEMEKQELLSIQQTRNEEKLDLEKQCGSIRKQVEELEIERAQMQSRIEELLASEQALMATISSSSDEKGEEIVKLEIARQEVHAQFDILKLENHVLENRIAELQRSNDELTSKLESAASEFETKQKSFEEDLASSKTSLNAAYEKIQVNDAAIVESSTKLAELSGRIETLQHEKSELETRVRELQDRELMALDKVSAQLAEFEEKLCSASVEKEALDAKVAELEAQIAETKVNETTSTVPAQLEAEIFQLKQDLIDKAEELSLIQKEMDDLFEENQALKSKVKKLEDEVVISSSKVEEKTEIIQRLETDLEMLRHQASVAEQERKMYLDELNQAGEDAARTKVELEKLKLIFSTQTTESACNTSVVSSLSTSHHEARTLCNTPNYGVSPPRKSRLSAVLPSFSSELSNDNINQGPSSAEKSVLTIVEASPAFTSPFSVSTTFSANKAQLTPSKPASKSESIVQTDEEPVADIIRRIQMTHEFRDRFMLKLDSNEAMASYHHTVALWDQMREKMQNENNKLRERADRLTDSIGKVIEGGQLSPLPSRPTASAGISVVEKTTLTATGGDNTLSVSTSEDAVDSIINRLRVYLKEKDDALRAGFSRERDNWSESAKEYEEEIGRLNKNIANLEKQISSKEDELKQATSTLKQIENDSSSNQNTVAELRLQLASKTDALRQKESELTDIKRSLDDRQTEIKRLQTELSHTTASLVVADQGCKDSERGFAVLQEQLMQEKAARNSAEAIVNDMQVKLTMTRAEADSWREKSCRHEDEEVRLSNELVRMQAIFEAAEEQVRSLTHQKTEIARNLEEMDSIVSQANSQRDAIVSKVEELERIREQLLKELQASEQEKTKLQLLNESLTKSADAAEEKVEKARTLFNRLRGEREALASRFEQVKKDNKRAAEIIAQMKEERSSLENLIRESAEKCQVLEARVEELKQERDLNDQGVQASRAEIRQLRDEQDFLKRELSKRLLDLGKAWRQCLINAGMPVSELTETDPHQLIQEIKWSSKHSVAKLNVLHAIQGLGITCKWLYDESYETMSHLEGSRRMMLARELEAAKTAEKLKEEAFKLRSALSGCRCRSNVQHAELLKIDEGTLEALNRKPIVNSANENDENFSKKKENKASNAEPFKSLQTPVNYELVDMEMSP